MTTADYALAVSILSFIVSLGGLWWNIWSKFIYPKAKIRTSFAVMTAIGADVTADFLSVTAVNFGPTDITLHNVISRRRTAWNWRRMRRGWQYAVHNPLESQPGDPEYTAGPFSGGLPKKLSVGEQFSSYLTINHQAFAEEPIIDVGFIDIFGRNHWVPRKHVREVRSKVQAHRAALPEHLRSERR